MKRGFIHNQLHKLEGKTAIGTNRSFRLDDDEIPGAFRTVLMLEDDEALGDLLRNFLEEKLYRVTWVRDGVEGVKQVLHSEYDCLLCDVMMPTFPGDMFYLAVQRINAQLCQRFIFMTGPSGSP